MTRSDTPSMRGPLDQSAVTKGRSSASRFGPIPLTRPKSSTERYGPGLYRPWAPGRVHLSTLETIPAASALYHAWTLNLTAQ